MRDIEKFYEMLVDLSYDYIADNFSDDMEKDREKGENDEIVCAFDTLKEYIETLF